MSRAVARKSRLVRVRHVQHAMAVADKLAAQAEADSIAHNASRIARVRTELFRSQDDMTGASFAAIRELADRLERAGRQLDGALYDANRRVDDRQAQQQLANREKEIAERLRERARLAANERIEARIAALPAARRYHLRGTE